MTEGEVQGKWVLVRNNGEFEITEFELAGSNCNYQNIVNNSFYPGLSMQDPQSEIYNSK